MNPAALDRVFGRGRLRMVTGDHVEVFREEALAGERRRYTKRFLATAAGDFRQWTEREWRILARLVGHGIGPVPDVVQFDRGTGGRQALVQTYDAGVTIDHWTTLLPVRREGEARAHVFEDCAHWWALARHSLVALDAIHELQLVHLDLKADNVCIPVGPADFDPQGAEARLFPDFERIALIDFAFSLVSGERLESALPIARQTEYDYQSPRLLQALDEGSRGNLWPTRQLDWRCDLFSLAAMLRRYLPDPERPDAAGWTGERRAQARALVRRLLEAHDAELPVLRPHAALIAQAADALRDPELADSLRRGWRLGESELAAVDVSPTPVTRIALPVTPLRESAEVISIDRSDVEGWAAANPPPRPPRRRRLAALAGGIALVAGAAFSVPLLGEAWRALVEPGSAPADGTKRAATPAPAVTRARVPVQGATSSALVHAPEKAVAASAVAQGPAASTVARARSEGPVAAAPDRGPPVASGEPVVRAPASAASAAPSAVHEAALLAERVAAATLAPSPAGMSSPGRTGPSRVRRTVTAATSTPSATAVRRLVAARPAAAGRAATSALRPGSATAIRPPPSVQLAKASLRVPARAPVYLPPAVGLAPLPSSLAAVALAAAGPGPASVASLPPAPAAEPVAAPPQDFAVRAGELMATQIPRLAQRAERMVLRVLMAAGNADEDGSGDDGVRLAAGAIRLAPDDPQLAARGASNEARQLQDASRAALRRGDLAEAVGLQTRAFGANPVDAEIVGGLALLRLRQGGGQAETARRLALHALTLHDWKHPSGRIEDWNTFAVASALTGHERDARNAWLVALALAGGSERQCRAAIEAYAVYGEPLRSPVQAMLQRASASARTPRPGLCDWPGRGSAGMWLR
ncbi:MAG: hypothetical protein ABI699_13745 [Caldimonas sp.]